MDELKPCPCCENTHLAIRTDIYKDGREFIYCDTCGCLADRRIWNRCAPAAQGADERALFEKWARDQMRGVLKPESLMMLEKDMRTAYYADEATAWAWEAFKAARAIAGSPPAQTDHIGDVNEMVPQDSGAAPSDPLERAKVIRDRVGALEAEIERLTAEHSAVLGTGTVDADDIAWARGAAPTPPAAPLERQAMEKALRALKLLRYCLQVLHPGESWQIKAALDTEKDLCAALSAAPVQEPVGEVRCDVDTMHAHWFGDAPPYGTKLYTSQQPASPEPVRKARMLNASEITALVQESVMTQASARSLIKSAAYKVLEVNSLRVGISGGGRWCDGCG